MPRFFISFLNMTDYVFLKYNPFQKSAKNRKAESKKAGLVKFYEDRRPIPSGKPKLFEITGALEGHQPLAISHSPLVTNHA